MKLTIERFSDHWSWEVEREDGTSVYGYEHDLDCAYYAASHALTCPGHELPKEDAHGDA